MRRVRQNSNPAQVTPWISPMASAPPSATTSPPPASGVRALVCCPLAADRRRPSGRRGGDRNRWRRADLRFRPGLRCGRSAPAAGGMRAVRTHVRRACRPNGRHRSSQMADVLAVGPRRYPSHVLHRWSHRLKAHQPRRSSHPRRRPPEGPVRIDAAAGSGVRRQAGHHLRVLASSSGSCEERRLQPGAWIAREAVAQARPLLPRLLPDGVKSGRSGRHGPARRSKKPQANGTFARQSFSATCAPAPGRPENQGWPR